MVGSSTSCQFNGCDTKTPNISFEVITCNLKWYINIISKTSAASNMMKKNDRNEYLLYTKSSMDPVISTIAQKKDMSTCNGNKTRNA